MAINVVEASGLSRFEIVVEIIKTSAIVIGVGAAVYEFVLKSEQTQRDIFANTVELMKIDLSETMVRSKTESFDLLLRRGGAKKLDTAGALEVERILLPQFQYFVAWEACIESGLCNESIAKGYICERVGAYWDTVLVTSEILGYDVELMNRGFFNLRDRCSTPTAN